MISTSAESCNFLRDNGTWRKKAPICIGHAPRGNPLRSHVRARAIPRAYSYTRACLVAAASKYLRLGPDASDLVGLIKLSVYLRERERERERERAREKSQSRGEKKEGREARDEIARGTKGSGQYRATNHLPIPITDRSIDRATRNAHASCTVSAGEITTFA